MVNVDRDIRLAAALVAEKMDQSHPGDTLWWLSYVDESDVFLGVALVSAIGPTWAVRRAHELGIAQAGEVATTPLLRQQVPDDIYRLMFGKFTRAEEVHAINEHWGTLQEQRLQGGA